MAYAPDLVPLPGAGSLIRAALAHARRHAGREVRFGPDGIEMVGFFGDAAVLARGGAPAEPRLGEVAAHLGKASFYATDRSFSRADNGGYDFGDLGVWDMAEGAGGAVRLRARKPGAPCLEGLVGIDAEFAAGLRALYRSGADLFVACEGEPRARAIVLALAAERLALGLPTSVDVPPKRDWRGRDEPHDHDGRESFDPPAGEGATPWTAKFLDEAETGNGRSYPKSGFDRLAGAIRDVGPDGAGRILVAARQNGYHGSLGPFAAAVEDRARPTALVTVSIEKSKPVAKVSLNAAARALAAAGHGFADAPWDRLAARRDRHAASRPAKPRTWHQTTAAVAESFVARQAPRGFESNRSLFFHGPVAFSVWSDSPIAAFVETPRGETILFVGREDGIGGGKGAIVSMATTDVERANDGAGAVPSIRMDRLATFLRLGAHALDGLASTMRRTKGEAAEPRSCSIDEAGLGRWFLARHAVLLEARERAYRTKVTYPTQTQADAERALVLHAEDREELSARLGVAIPPVGDLAAYRASHDEARAKVDARQADLARRRAGLPPEAPPGEADGAEAPAPRF